METIQEEIDPNAEDDWFDFNEFELPAKPGELES